MTIYPCVEQRVIRKGVVRSSAPEASHTNTCRNLEAAQAVVTAAKAADRQPQLSSLLIEPSWLQHMRPEFDKPYFKQLQKFLDAEWKAQSVYPPPEMIFRSVHLPAW